MSPEPAAAKEREAARGALVPRAAVAPTLLERAWYGEGSALASVASPVLRAAAWGFGRIAAARSALYDKGYLAPVRVDAHVISVGNLNVGGAGKTPVVVALAERLVARGKRVAVVSRGYGGKPAGTVVTDGERLLQGSREAGDEPVLIARRVPGACVLVGARRAAIAREAVARFGAQVILLDDGFQHRALARDEDILVLGGSAPLGNGRLLPAGPLREPPAAAARATIAWLANGAERAALPPSVPAKRICARYRAVDVLDWNLRTSLGRQALEGKRVLMLAGLARPGGFARTLAELGAEVVEIAIYRDHHPYSLGDLERVEWLARRSGAELVATTEKDAVRLEKTRPPRVPVVAVRIDVEILDGDRVLEELLARC